MGCRPMLSGSVGFVGHSSTQEAAVYRVLVAYTTDVSGTSDFSTLTGLVIRQSAIGHASTFAIDRRRRFDVARGATRAIFLKCRTLAGAK